ncbi:MAG TPA: hypothetical protein VEA61_00200 [Allosphingosinicella sp.]|nr:hypothetical protein [Allosphingosinicella sp.]
MNTRLFALALLIGGAAFAQTGDTIAYDGDGLATAAFETEPPAAYGAGPATAAAGAMPAAAGVVIEPSNANPERDARGIAVISAAAVAPPGWNGTPAAAGMGGPELDAVTGEPLAPDSYPACTATVTDKCLQTYERQVR